LAEQAYAYVTLIPVAKGFKSALTKELNGIDGVGSSLGSSTGSKFKDGFTSAIKGAFKVATVAAGVAAAGLGATLASGFQRLTGIEEAQAKLLGLGNTTEDVALIMDNALSAVRGTAYGMADAATISASAVAAGVKPGQELARYLKTTADAAYIAGAGLDEMGAILNKATTSGKAQNDVLGQLAERGIPIYQMLGESAGVAAGQIFDMASNGVISSEMLMEALETNLGGAALESGNTVAGAFANMRAAIQRVGANLLGPSFGYFKDFFLGIIAFLAPVEEKAKVVGQVIADFLAPMAEDFAKVTTQFSIGNLDISAMFDRTIASIKRFFTDGGLIDTMKSAFDTMAEFRLTIFNAILKALPAMIDAFVEFLPTLIDFFINTMLPGLITQFKTIVNELISVITRLLPQMVDSLVSMIPMLLDAAIDLFDSLVEAVIEITPKLIDALIYLLPKMVDTLLSLLPELLDAALDLFTAIVDALPLIIPPLIMAIIDLLPVIMDTLVDMIPELVDAAFELFTGIVTAIYRAAPDIYSELQKLLPGMLKTLGGFVASFVEAGFNLISGLVRGIVTNGPRLVGEAISSIGNTVVNTFKNLLGINSPSKVFTVYGNNIGEGLAYGIHEMVGPVESATKALGDATTKVMDDTIDALETKFTTITNIPSMLADGISEAVKISMADVQRMAETVEGLFAVFDKNGDLFQSYSGYGVSTMVPTVGGGQLDVGKFTDTINSLQKAGYSNLSDAFGGSTQQVLDKLMGQQTFTNAAGMQTTVGGTVSDRMLADLAAKGFTALPSLDKSVEELTDAIDSLNSQVAERGLTPFASGGLVTGPTSALIGEAGPEVVIPLNRFESMMGLSQNNGGAVNYYAAPNNSIDSEQALFQAMRRAKVVANW
jgi:tape measure domain-containing protein